MTKPDISVVIPAHNRADLVGDAIMSALDQKGCVTEVIVVDDGSTDHTSRVLDEFGDRIKVLRTDGIERGAARNFGARAARAPILGFLDSDDYWTPEKVSRQLVIARTGTASVTGVHFEDPAGQLLRTYAPAPDAISRLLVENPFLGSASSLVLPRGLFFDLGGFPEELAIQGTEDWLLLVKLLRAGHRVQVIPDPLLHARVHGSNFTSDPDRVALSMWAATEWLSDREMLSRLQQRRLRARTAVVIARQFAWKARLRSAWIWLTRAFKQGSPIEAFQGVLLVPLSFLKGRLEWIRAR